MSEPSGGAPAEGGSQSQATQSSTEPQAPQSAPKAPPTESKPMGDEPSKTEPDKPTGIKLPGVVHRNDDFGPDLPLRDSDGKFRSRKERQDQLEREMLEEKGITLGGRPEDEGGKQTPPEPPPGSDQKKVDPAAPEKFTFAGKEYESKEAAEQSIKSFQGMFKPLQAERDQMVTLANQWKEYAENIERRYQQGTPPAASPAPTRTPQSPAPQLDAKTILNAIDGAAFEKIAQDPDKGLPYASRFLAAQILDAVNQHLIPQVRQQAIDEMNQRMAETYGKDIQSYREQRAFEDATTEVAEIFNGVRALKDQSTGEPAFPELNDPDTARKVGELWSKMNLPMEYALSPQGVLQAIANYRMYYGPPQPKTTPASPAPQREVPPPAAAASDGGTPSRVPGGQKFNPEDAFTRALDEASLVDPVLGFQVRRRR